MQLMSEVMVPARDIGRFGALLGEKALVEVRAAARTVLERLAGGAIWNVNSTAVGGGVAEMLHPLIGYSRGLGLDARWVVIAGSDEFFTVTKRIHHHLHGERGDGGPLGNEQRRLYEDTLRADSVELAARIRPDDVVILHDPQTAGMAPAMMRAGAKVVWRCHIGHDKRGPEIERGWAFLRPYLAEVPRVIFSRRSYVPAFLAGDRAAIIPPSIDAFSPKNEDLADDAVRAILVQVGLVEGPPPSGARPEFTRSDGTPGRVERPVDVVRLGGAPAWETPLVVQVSRWDPLKDPMGVLEGFRLLLQPEAPRGAQLVLAGPDARAIADDPEGREVFAAVEDAWRCLPDSQRRRIDLVSLPMGDVEENAAIVNALQRHAAVIVQKSLHEGFGLTVTEAMWKGRPIVASAVGGIQDQIRDGIDGILLRDPTDLAAFAAAVRRLLEDAELARRLGESARARAGREYLGLRSLLSYAALVGRLAAGVQLEVGAPVH